MKEQKFVNGSLEFDAYLLEDGRYVFNGADICVRCGLSDLAHAARYIRHSLPEKWYLKMKPIDDNRTSIYVLEPGIYYLLMRTRNEESFEFRNWVVEEVLPNIRKQGFHIDSEAVLADRSKLEALEKQTESLRNQLEVAEQLNFQIREYIDSELGKAKQKAAEVATEKVTSEVKVEYQCYTDAIDGNPVVYAAEMKRQRDEAIADKQKIISDNAYRALSVRDHIRKELEHKFQRQLKEETLSVPKEETLQIPKQSQPESETDSQYYWLPESETDSQYSWLPEELRPKTTAPTKKITTRKKKTKNQKLLDQYLSDS